MELFRGLASLFKAERKIESEEKKENKISRIEKEGIMKDSYEERLVRKIAEKKAGDTAEKIVYVYKKSHGMIEL